MIKVLIGNMFETKAQTLVNTVNCVGVMGKGIAQEFKKRFPDMYKEYIDLCNSHQVKLSIPYHYKDIFNVSIVNFPTKDHWRAMSRLDNIRKGLDIFVEKYKEWGIKSVAFPPLGCGNGGLEWRVVGPVIYKKLLAVNIPVELYAPFGTPQKFLTEEFLAGAKASDSKNIIGKKHAGFKPEWVAVLEVLYNLERQPYVKPVGRTIFQKICYVMQEAGIDLGFRFTQGSYGPYSQDIKKALMVMANSNMVFEQQLGKMTALRTGPEFKMIRKEYKDTVQNLKNKIDKVSDLFMRIKDTTQAEEVTTVFFVIRKLKKQKESVSENEIYDDILKWKTRWDEPEKKQAIASAIRNLGMLRWIKVDFSESLKVNELEI
ncbi:MAG: macro domain-containing protein [Planctomycetes bacterium]|nr:macro domain-containing protein [Planctomycetota bacterium]MBU1518047.1 macro domain-containing protein [Planctomycetota bacterium]MBU2457645.1 macro domain-containing protein [Planctomycetota bacterium]MBU2597379.1 macro domain-containing protein [Planctomycetota bacterium]